MSDAGYRQIRAAATEWFVRLQEEGASEQDFQQWQMWLKASPDHQRAFQDVEQAWRLIEDVRPVPWASVRELERDRSKGVPRWAIAASVLIFACVAAFSWRQLSPSRSAGYATATAEQRSVLLTDGSRITLGARSRVTPRLAERERRVVLHFGEAFFEVAPDPGRPFTVVAQDHDIQVLGTSFNVRASEAEVVIGVAEGRIAISGADGKRMILGAGEQVTLGAAGRVEREDAATAQIATWRQGRFEYRREALRQVVADLNRYTDRPIVIEDESVGDLSYTGTVLPDHLNEWLAGIGGVLPVQVREADGERRISRAP
jgi:transmembrane sensor